MQTKQNKRALVLGDNLNHLLKLHDLDIKNLAIETGVPAATIARMRREGSNPTIATIEPLLDFFRIDMDTLLYADMANPEYQAKKNSGKFVHIPVVSMEEANSPHRNTKVIKFVGAAGVNGKNVFGINIATESLAPAFQNNSIVIIDPDLKPKESDYILCCLGDNTKAVFRQFFSDGDDYFFKPINPGFGEMKLCEKFTIIGVVIKSIESYRE